MKQIEDKISALVRQQFPDFYKEEGDQFVAFVASYYEWLEQENNVIGEARNLTQYRDIDETLEEFIVHFKEKYLSNIQFDTASNKVLLVKNALDLYRSKGTERSIDLFFKLVYGTNAEVSYPADNILRASDGIWETPQYLEIGYSKYNIDYVGKQIIGSNSGSTAFVDRYIRRRTAQGYVNLLYVTNIEGRFKNNEVLGLIQNDRPVFDVRKRSKLIGSIRNVIVENRGRDFNVGDIVNLVSPERGSGGLARVSSIGSGTGIVDFIFIDGGYGYTRDSRAIISEKILNINLINSNIDTSNYFDIQEYLYQPIVFVQSDNISSSIQIGDTLQSYNNNIPISSSTVVDRDVNSLDLGVNYGSISNNTTYFKSGNTASVNINHVEDRTVVGSLMNNITTISLEVSNLITANVGETVYQFGDDKVIAQGTITSVNENSIILSNVEGSFNKTLTVQNINREALFNITIIRFDVGVYDVRSSTTNLSFNSANNDSILNSDYIYKYSDDGLVEAEAKIVTSEYSSNSGSITIVPLSGYFKSGDTFYTDSNNTIAIVQSNEIDISGGDFVTSSFSESIGSRNKTKVNIINSSFGTGASFNISNIGDTEDVFLNTDIISNFNNASLDFNRSSLTVASNTSFKSGDYVYQEINKIAINPAISINNNNGFISLPSANSKYTVGDLIKYTVDTGNTNITSMNSGDFYYVKTSNSSGITISYPYRTELELNRNNFDDFNLNPVSETGHFISKIVYGTVE